MKKPLFIAGPTAAGKSAVAIELARRLGGEIISVDSMQVYRGLDIGTAKPTPEERASVQHHLIDIVDLQARFDAAEFITHARSACEAIQSRGRVPIFCGGTGLYFKAYLEGLGDAPPADPALRMQLEQKPLRELLAELEVADPVTFARIDRDNPRRVIRAVEVIRLTGKPFSLQRAHWEAGSGPKPLAFFGFERTADNLRRRIDERVDQMFAQGLVEEVSILMRHGLGQNSNACQALGYRQVIDHLNGALSLDNAIELVKQKTRQYAKRQMTWFRHQAQLEWLKCAEDESVCSLADRLGQRYLALA